MKELFFMGGQLFMSILSILLVIMTGWIIYQFVVFINKPERTKEMALRQLRYGREVGLFALIVGITGQLVGFYYAFSAIEEAADISPAMIFGGIKVSLITTIYGILIFLFGMLLWFIATQLVERDKR